MFSQLREKRFPQDRVVTDVGPGSYEVPSSLDVSNLSARLNTSCDRSLLDLNDSVSTSFNIFVDEEKEKAPKTPRSARKPFAERRSTKENIIVSGLVSGMVKAKSLGAQDEDLVKRRLLGSKAKDGDKDRITELQNTVEELQQTCRAAETKIAGLESQKEAAVQEALETRLRQVHEEKENLQENLEAATCRVRALETAAGSVPSSASEVVAMVEKLVVQELENPRKAFCLYRSACDEQVNRLQEQNDRLEMQVEKRCKLYKRQEKEAIARAEQAETMLAELRHAEAIARAAQEAISLAECRQMEPSQPEEEVERLRGEVARLQEVAEEKERQLQTSQLEEQRLNELLAVSQETMSRYREREAEWAGHANHHQKIRYTMKMKQEHDQLRGEVDRLRKELYHQKRQGSTSLLGSSMLSIDSKAAADTRATGDVRENDEFEEVM